MIRLMILILPLCCVSLFAYAQTSIIYSSKKLSPQPTLVFVHGGAWVSRSAADYRELGESLADRGFCNALVDYRLAPEVSHPEPVSDLNHALEKLQKVSLPNCDLKHFVLVGHSAGAHMIAFWATEHISSKVIGFVGVEGIYDIPALVREWPAYKNQFITAEFGDASKWPRASPTLIEMKNRSPWLIVHSNKDELVDVAQSRQFRESLLKQKIVADLNLSSDENHFGVIDSWRKKDSALTKAINNFINNLPR